MKQLKTKISLSIFFIFLTTIYSFSIREYIESKQNELEDLNQKIIKEKKNIDLLNQEINEVIMENKNTRKGKTSEEINSNTTLPEKRMISSTENTTGNQSEAQALVQTESETDTEKEKIDYKIEKLGNDSITKKQKDYKPKNVKCEELVSFADYVYEVDTPNRVIKTMPVRIKLTKNTLSVFLDYEENSIRDNIRLENINVVGKSYGLKNSCVEFIPPQSKKNEIKSISFCFPSEKELKVLVFNIKEMKRCFLTFETIEHQKLAYDYKIMKFLLESQYKLKKEKNISLNKKSSSEINEKLRDLYYTNNMDKINKQEATQDKIIDKILDELVEKSLIEKAKAESRQRHREQFLKKEYIVLDPSIPEKVVNKFISPGRVKEKQNEANNTPKESMHSSVITELKSASSEVYINICVKKSTKNEKITDETFREKICEIIEIEKGGSASCNHKSKTEFCSTCCAHIAENSANCVSECNK